MENIFAINKPKGPTSNDVLNEIRKKLSTRKVGHAGTLDPLAEGVLVVGVNKGTKELESVVKKEKEYIADITLGITSTTDDEEGEKTEHTASKKPDIADIENVLKNFSGNIKQIPPIYSAVKVQGKEAYKYARKGQEIKLGPRDVEIKLIEILEYAWPHLTIRAITGPGVYIRSLARDIGEALGCGAYLSDLKRTRVGDFTIEKSITVDEIHRTHLNNI